MKKRNYICLILSFLILCSGIIGLLPPIRKTEVIVKANDDVYEGTELVADTNEENSNTFSVPVVHNVMEDEDYYLFSMTEPTQINGTFTYPVVDLPKTINYARELTFTFTNLAESIFTHNNYDILDITLSISYEEGGTRHFLVGTADAPLSIYSTERNDVTNTITNRQMDNTIVVVQNTFIGKTLDVNLIITYNSVKYVENKSIYETTPVLFSLYCHKEIALNSGNKLTDDVTSTKNFLYVWNVTKPEESVSTIFEPIYGAVYRNVSLTYPVILHDSGLLDSDNNPIYEDIGLANIKINGTIYQASTTTTDENNKFILFDKSGKYNVAILSNEYQEGIDKEYTYRAYSFTINNQKNIVAYSTKDGSEIVNFGKDDVQQSRYQFLNSHVILNFFGYNENEVITYFYQSGVSGGTLSESIKLTEDILNNGYELSKNGKYYDFTYIEDNGYEINNITIPLTFYICSGILTSTEQSAINAQLEIFKRGTNIDYTSTRRAKIDNTEYIDTYSISGLSIQFGSDNNNQNVHTTNTYHYDFQISVAEKPSIKLSPALSNGGSTTSNIVINTPQAAGAWKLSVKNGNNVKTYTRDNFDNISLKENGKYEITITDGANQSVSLTVTKRFTMNFATIMLIIVGVIGTVIMTYAIIKNRFALQVK